MPRTLKEILEHADELADRFEAYEPKPEDRRDPAAMHALRAAVVARSEAERAVADAVAAMRKAKYSWASIGGVLGTSAQAAHQRYAKGTDGDGAVLPSGGPTSATAGVTAVGGAGLLEPVSHRSEHAVPAAVESSDFNVVLGAGGAIAAVPAPVDSEGGMVIGYIQHDDGVSYRFLPGPAIEGLIDDLDRWVVDDNRMSVKTAIPGFDAVTSEESARSEG